MKKKLHIGILFGGKSPEHVISILSARNVYQAIDKTQFIPHFIYISQNGYWYNFPENDISLTPEKIMEGMKVTESVNKQTKGSFYLPTLVEDLDVLFPVLHGTNGEDGTIQGLMELLGLPYIGSGVLGSAVGMDKDIMKRLLRDGGLPVARFQTVHKSLMNEVSYQSVSRELGSTLFIKPANLGSSIGIHKVTGEKEFVPAVTDAFRYDSKIIIEEYIPAREIECAVLGNEKPEASLPGEIVPNAAFYTYEAKYLTKDGAQVLIPATLTKSQTKTVRDMACEAFVILNCSGLARVDFFLQQDTGKIYLNEINTLPGFTDSSMYPALWQASGVSYPELITQLIVLAIEKHEEKKALKFNR